MNHRTLFPARTLPALAAALFSLVVLTGCGGSSGGSDGGSKHAAAAKGYTSAKDVGDALKCKDTLDGMKVAGATDALLCGYAGDNVVVSWFSSAALAKSFQHRAPQASQPTVYVYGSNWAVGCFSKSVCESAHKVLGGRLG
ncbi:MAG: hypothetical protein QOJ72_887 [Nocardioidaceae bacterium]|nr:hypothetical protein [Nocardioidaceae bacterium]